MEKKLMSLMGIFRIGHKSVILLVVVFCSGCNIFSWDEKPNKSFQLHVKNATNDTLVLSYSKGGFFGVSDIEEKTIYPDSFILLGNCGLDNEESPIPDGFNEWLGYDSCWIYKYDPIYIYQAKDINNYSGLYYPPRANLQKVWSSPFRYDEESFHSFFNYNSWEVVDSSLDSFNGIILFTIHKSDLTNIID